MTNTSIEDMFGAHRSRIEEAVRRLLPQIFEDLRSQRLLLPGTLDRMLSYILRGKLIRGSLIPLVAGCPIEQSPSDRPPIGQPPSDRPSIEQEQSNQRSLDSAPLISEDDVYAVAAAMELFQSMLIIHDDIMDNDALRRGMPAAHSMYRQDAEAEGLGDPAQYGVAMGMCFGDLAAFAAFSILSALRCDEGLRRFLFSMFSRELFLVGMAQMQDMRLGRLPLSQISAEDIINIYRCKTGRYTFSLPVCIGAGIAGILSLSEALGLQVDADGRGISERPSANKGGSEQSRIEKAAEYIGIIFQIRDDEIGLYGDPAKTGKPNTSDLEEGKKTIFMQYLSNAQSTSEQSRLQLVLSNFQGAEDWDWVHAQLKRYAVREQVEARVRGFAQSASESIAGIGNSALQGVLSSLLDYNLGRSR